MLPDFGVRILERLNDFSWIVLANADTDAEANRSSWWDNPAWGMLWRLFVFIGVLALAYFAIKKMARLRFMGKKGAELDVIEAVAVAPQSTVQIVKAGTRIFLVGVTRERVSLLAELEEKDLKYDEAAAGTGDMDEHNNRGVFKTPVPLEKYLNIFKKSDKDKDE